MHSSSHSSSSSEMTEDERHDAFMKEALQEGRRALARGEVPVGCVFVYENEIIACASNRVNELCNATKHAEIVAIEAIAAKYGAKAPEMLHQSTLYVTCEPCIMCTGALSEVGIARCYFGCHNDRFGGCSSVLSLHETSAFPDSEVYNGFPCVTGLLKDEAVALLRSFYDMDNPRVVESKRKHRKQQQESTVDTTTDATSSVSPPAASAGQT